MSGTPTSPTRAAVDSLVLLLATARLTRFITTDLLGEWWLVRRAKAWAGKHEGREIETRIEELAAQNFDRNVTYVLSDGSSTDNPAGEIIDQYDEHNPFTWQAKMVKGLDCPFCVGFWIGAVVLALTPLRRLPILGPLWKLGLHALALNYVVGHVSSRLDT